MAIPLKYNLRSLLVRRVSTLMTSLSIALVVAIFIGVMALAGGLEKALVSSGDPMNVLVRRKASDSELSSSVPHEAFQAIKNLSGIQTDGNAEPAVTAEIITLINLAKRGQEQGSNVTIRGISPPGMSLRPQIKIVEGRMFQQGLREAIVSRSISERFQGANIGDQLRFARGDWTVVGIFDAGRTAFDSEIWVDVNQLANSDNRQSYSSLLVRAIGSSAIGDIVNRIESDRRFDLMAQRETDYYAEQTASTIMIKVIGFFIAAVMGVGACFAAMNTMYAAVAYRTREIATLLVLGFKRWSILLSFLIESVLLALAGGVLGCLLALPVNGITTGTTNFQTFSEVAFAFQVSPQLMLIGLLFATVMGLFGGFFPALRAASQKPAMAMREV